jgi:chemotaxis protein methyltransferase WspC
MVQDSIETILQQKLGLDANSVGSRIIARAVEQRQKACGVSDRAAYLAYLQSASQELNQLIEAVVVPETWFFRDKGPFEYLRQFVQPFKPERLHTTPVTASDLGGVRRPQPLRLLSVPCSTGEEPYSIAITLLEAGLSPDQFRIDAVDVSQLALMQAKRGTYRKKSFRGSTLFNLERYFQSTEAGCQIQPSVSQRVNFIQGNILEPHFLVGQRYDVIFCRNLLIYLAASARQQVIESLDQALRPAGLLFLGAVETLQLANMPYQAIAHPAAFAFQKQSSVAPPPTPIQRSPRDRNLATQPPSRPRPQLEACRPLPSPPLQPRDRPTALETAHQLADQGQLTAAAELCETYVRSHPSQVGAYLLLGNIYQGLNQLRQAEQAFQKALYLYPDTYEALIHLALLKEQQGQQSEAERLRQRAQRALDSDFHVQVGH